MKKITALFAFLLTFTLLLGALAACQNDTTTDTDTDAPTGAEQSTETRIPEFSIEAGDGSATVTTESGFTYTATGYDTLGDKTFGFANGLVLDLGDAFTDEFNRFTIKYSATAPMKITISYTEKDEPMQDTFYLEAGEKEFRAVNHKYFQKVRGSALVTMQIDTCENQNAEFVLLDLFTENIAVGKSQQYLEGSRYTLGVDLKWGGAIHSLEDKQCPLEDVTNLVNMHDEGRLIQQSYYGVFYREAEYKEGGYLGVEGVAYNPVQGGDVKGRDSRIIDFVIEDNYIYIKAQPLDWPLSNSLTPSYMENKYVMEDEYVYVFNRFVDFSGWKHPLLDQELPALYTINVLDTFVWYDGGKPWTGDALSTITDWSKVDPNTNKSSHYLQLKETNTETWSALINGETGYGVGIYVPNTDLILTMRYLSGEKGSNQGKGNPCSYISPLARIAFKSFEPIEYSYLLTAGDINEIRDVFTKNRDFDTNEGLNIKKPSRAPYVEEGTDVTVDLTVSDGLSTIYYPRNTEYGYNETEQAFTFKATAEDPNVTFVFDYGGAQLFAEDYGTIEITYMIPTTNADSTYETQLFLCCGSISAPTAEATVTGELIADGQYHTLQIKVKDLEFWNGLIHMIRFDYFSAPEAGDTVYVKTVKLVAN